MGDAKRRKAEIDRLKLAAPSGGAAIRQARLDQEQLRSGVDPTSSDPEPTAALARVLYTLLERSKADRNIDLVVTFLQSKVDATVSGQADVPIACGKGCSHCCHSWVSATAPEVIHVAKLIRLRPELVARIGAAHQATGQLDFDARGRHPAACPLLEQDACSIYDARPNACRLAASADAAVCARAYRGGSGEAIPLPTMYLRARSAYAVALAAAARKAALPYRAYEFNAALVRALDTDDAERLWLEGRDIFSDIRTDPVDMFANPRAEMLYRLAFGAA
jgi:Fe-S-cluster containining protein